MSPRPTAINIRVEFYERNDLALPRFDNACPGKRMTNWRASRSLRDQLPFISCLVIVFWNDSHTIWYKFWAHMRWYSYSIEINSFSIYEHPYIYCILFICLSLPNTWKHAWRLKKPASATYYLPTTIKTELICKPCVDTCMHHRIY